MYSGSKIETLGKTNGLKKPNFSLVSKLEMTEAESNYEPIAAKVSTVIRGSAALILRGANTKSHASPS